MSLRPLIILTGPTAVGKTDLSITLARAIGGEIISADSMQVYRNMDIGTAKILPTEMKGIPHYLIDVLDPSEDFNVVLFQKMAKEALETIYMKGKIPIVVGGTGFYIQALLYDIDFEENSGESEIRKQLEQTLKEKGSEYLHAELKRIDPDSAKAIHANNSKRVIRAIEYYKQTGELISKHNEEQKIRPSAYNSAYFVLTNERQVLYERINARIDQMLKEGLLEEVKSLKDAGYTRDLVSMQGLGYKELLAYLDGEISLEEAIYILKRDTRHFAKRQLTWFKRERDVIIIEKDKLTDTKEQLDAILKVLKNRNICSVSDHTE